MSDRNKMKKLRGESKIRFKPKGIMPALVTPFTSDDRIDEDSLRGLVGAVVDAGVDGLIPIAGTGECVSLSNSERKKIFTIVQEEVKGKKPVIPGVLGTGIKDVTEIMKFYEDSGASAVLLLTPYYNQPTQDGIYEYYKEIIEASNIPIILYNIPARTGVNIEPETLARLADIEQIVGIKECNRELGQMQMKLRLAGDRIQILAGDDDIAFQMMSIGAKGAILASACLIPEVWINIFKFLEEKNVDATNELNNNIVLPLCKPLFAEHNPAPLKEALVLMGRIKNAYCRKPLLPVTDGTKKKLQQTMKSLKLLK